MKFLKFICLFLILTGTSLTKELIKAISEGNISQVKKLLNEGVDVNIKDKDGSTALIWASSHGNKQIVKMLLEIGAYVDINIVNKYIMLISEEILNILRLEQAIKESKDLNPYVNKLSEEDLVWFINRVISNRNIGELGLEDIEKLVPKDYKELVIIYKKLKSGHVSIEKILKEYESIVGSKKLNNNAIRAYELLKENIEKIDALNKTSVPLSVAAKIILEH